METSKTVINFYIQLYNMIKQESEYISRLGKHCTRLSCSSSNCCSDTPIRAHCAKPKVQKVRKMKSASRTQQLAAGTGSASIQRETGSTRPRMNSQPDSVRT